MKRKSVYFIALAVILVISMILTACGSSSPTTPGTTSTTTPVASTPSQTTAPATTAPGTTEPAGTTPVQTSSPRTGGILTIISPNAPNSFGYPIKNTGFAPNFANQPCLESLIDADLNGNILPRLALSWEIAPDKSAITFELRQGVKFHDGTDFNAEAVKWNLDKQIERGTGSPADWESVEVLGEYTVRINLKQFKNTQLSNMTYPMISPSAVEKNGVDWATTHPVGTGPFKLKEFIPNTSLEFERFDDYWGDKALVDGIKFIYIVDTTTAAMAFKSGDALVWETADVKTAAELTKEGYKIESRRGPIMNLIPDSVNPDSPFYKLEVRQAIEYAIDKQAICDALGYGTWEVVNQPNVPEQFGHIENFAGERNYDPEKAKELLAQAGYPNGFSTTIITSVALPKEPLVAIQDYLAEIGVNVTIDVQSAAKWAETRTSGWKNGLFYVTHGATDYNYCAYLERYFTPTSTFAPPAIAYPDDWMELVDKMMQATEREEMASLSQDAVRYLVENALEIPLFVRAEVYLLNPKVHDMGVGTHGDGFTWNVNKVWISE